MEDTGLIGIGILLVIQIGLFAFGYGKLNQKVKGLSQSATLETVDRKEANVSMHHAFDERAVLPECQETFQEILQRLASVETKQDMLIRMGNKRKKSDG
jgi:hypothetical protein